MGEGKKTCVHYEYTIPVEITYDPVVCGCVCPLCKIKNEFIEDIEEALKCVTTSRPRKDQIIEWLKDKLIEYT